MSLQTLTLIAIGGAAGSVVRALVGFALRSSIPWATLAVNVAGSLLIGWLMSRLAGVEGENARRLHALWVTGFCGGFTTFSAFSWQTLEQMQKGQWASVAVNVILSLGLCLLAVALGFRVGKI